MSDNHHSEGLATPVRYVKGVGEIRAEQLARLDISTVGDLLLTLPRRYDDRRQFVPIGSLRGGETATVRGTIMSCGWVAARYGKGFFEALLRDDSGIIRCRWFNSPYLKDQLKQGDAMVAFGKVSRSKGFTVFQHPEFELAQDDGEESLHVGRIVPIYALTEHLPQRTMRRIAWNAVELFARQAEEMLPPTRYSGCICRRSSGRSARRTSRIISSMRVGRDTDWCSTSSFAFSLCWWRARFTPNSSWWVRRTSPKAMSGNASFRPSRSP